MQVDDGDLICIVAKLACKTISENFTLFNFDKSEYPFDRNKFLSRVDSYMVTTDSFGMFNDIVSRRVEMILKRFPGDLCTKNLYQLITSDEARAINGVVPFADLPDQYLNFEQNAIALFGNILICWAEFELYKILERAKSYSGEFENRPVIANPIDESCESEIIQNIENDSRLFMTYHSDMAMYLSDAIPFINIETLVKEQCWYEILFFLDLSCSGMHYIFYTECNKKCPLIISTALIQDWSKRKNWLTFDPFFQTDDWVLSLSREDLRLLYTMDFFSTNSQSVIRGKSVKEFESDLHHNIKKPKAVSEVIRMTVSGPHEKRLKYLYLTQKLLMNKLLEEGIYLAFTIIEQPAMLFFYHAANRKNTDTTVYITTSFRYLSGSRNEKGYWLTENLSKELNGSSFKEYRKKIISIRKN